MSKSPEPTPNLRLRKERERRCWSQQELADQIGTTPLNVSRWERGITVPGSYFRQKLCDLFEKNAQQLGLLAETIEQPDLTLDHPAISVAAQETTHIWHVPYSHNLFFTGRVDILARIRALFSEREEGALTQPLALSGLGGIGKTQTAVEYAYRYRDDYQAVFWVRADSYELLVSDFLVIASLLKLAECNTKEQTLVINAVKHWFATYDRWLLIFDNADHLELVSPFLPSVGNGDVLLTTRSQSTGTIAHRLELEKMSVAEGLLFLLRRAKYLRGNLSLDSVSAAARKHAQSIVELLDGLPLALDQVAAYIEETGCSLADYLKLYRTRRLRLLRMRGRSATGHPEPVAATWALSFEMIEQANPASAELLRFCAFLHPDAIPEALLMAGADELGPLLQPVLSDELDMHSAIGELLRYSLVYRDTETRILRIHRLVQAVLKDAMAAQDQRMWAERTIRAVNCAFPDVDFSTWDRCQQYLPHAQVCASLLEEWNIFIPQAVHLLSRAGLYLQARAQYAEAEHFNTLSLYICEQIFGAQDISTANSQHDLAWIYYLQGKYEQGETLFLQAMATRERLLGAEHLDVAECLNGLAVLYLAQGKYDQSELYGERALKIREQLLAPEHLDIADSFHNMGFLLHDLGRYQLSASYYERALSIREKKLGPQHPLVAETLNNLALLYYDQGIYEQAESLYLRALSIREQASGLHHPDVALCLNNLGLLYWKQLKYAQAEQLYQRALTVWEHALGPNHPDVATCLNNLGKVHQDQQKYTSAEQFHLRALTIREQCLGADHPDVAFSLNNLALLHQAQGEYEQAEQFHLRAIVIREQRLGLDHPLLATSLHNLAHLYHVQERYSQAEQFYRRAFTIREQALGLDHLDTLTTLEKYSSLLQAMQREHEAIALRQRIRTTFN